MELRNPGFDDGRCALCRERVLDPEEHRCHGCGYIVCVYCDETHPMGKHDVIEHKELSDDEEADEDL